MPNKEAILHGMIEAVYEEMAPSLSDTGFRGDWRSTVVARCQAMRRAIARHSWILGLIESRQHHGPARLRHHDAALGDLLRGGFTPIEAVQAVAILDSHVYGSVLQQHQQNLEGPGEVSQAAADFLAHVDMDDLPSLRAVALAVSTGAAPDHDDLFTRGLDAILDGLTPSRLVSG